MSDGSQSGIAGDPSVPWLITEEKVQAAVERIVDASHPYAVILFGSYVRGEATPGSDLDLLVVADDSVEHCRRESVRLRRVLRGISMPVDIVVVRRKDRKDLERFKNTPGLIYENALKEGKVAYERG